MNGTNYDDTLTTVLSGAIVCDVSHIGVDEVNMNVWRALVTLKIVTLAKSENRLRFGLPAFSC